MGVVNMDLGLILERFNHIFGHDNVQVITSCPGRINLIGEHIDYNGGHVLPMAIDYRIYLAVGENGSSFHRLFSDIDGNIRKIGVDEDASPGDWAGFVLGAMDILGIKGKSGGLDLLYLTNIPIGAGLSSSVAISVVTLEALVALFDMHCTKEEIAFYAQRIEHEKIGVLCGIMDQFAVCISREGMALLIDTLSNQYKHIPLDFKGAGLGIIDSGITRRLTDSSYNTKRMECEEIKVTLDTKGIIDRNTPLARLSNAQYERSVSILKESLGKRLRHIYTEEKRVMEFCDALSKGDVYAAGRLLNLSHKSLSGDYEVSTKELDFIVERAIESHHVFGARLIGAGFGGSVLILYRDGRWDDISSHILRGYHEYFDKEAKVYSIKSGYGSCVEFRA